MGRKCIELSDDSKKFILNNYTELSVLQLSGEIGCSWGRVKRFMDNNKLEAKTGIFSKEKGTEILSKLFSIMSIEDIALVCEVSEAYVKSELIKKGLLDKKKRWTKEEEILLKQLWGKVSIDELQEMTGFSIEDILIKSHTLRLGKLIPDDCIHVQKIARMFNMAVQSVFKYWVPLGLNINYIKLSEVTTYNVVNKDDLISFLRNNQDLWDSRSLDEKIIEIEDDWYVEKKNKDIKSKKIIRCSKWSEEDKKVMWEMQQQGYSLKEIACFFKSSVNTVGGSIYKMKNKYKVEYITVKSLSLLTDINYKVINKCFRNQGLNIYEIDDFLSTKYVRVEEFNKFVNKKESVNVDLVKVNRLIQGGFRRK